MKRIFTLVLGLKLILISADLCAQVTTYNQFWNDFQFVTPIKGRWSNEINLGQVWTGVPANNNPFYANAQLYARVWIHYSLSKAKFSVFTGYNHNPEIILAGQDGLPEIRSAIQGIYYFRKTPFTLSARLRLEDHRDKRSLGGFDESYRVRSQLKLVKPLNASQIVKGAVYMVASEEVFTQTAPNVFSQPRLGSNRLTIGCGYALTDDFLIEVDYANDYYPDKIQQLSYHSMQLNLSCYNWVKNLKDALLK